MYTYWGEPDHTMHDQGVMAVGDMVRDIDDRVRSFCQAMDEDTLVLVTADHGLLDCECRYTCDYPELEQALTRPFHIEARAAGFYVKPEYRKVFPQLFDAAFGHDDFWLVSTDAALSMGLLGGGTPRADIREIIGDYIAIATGRYSLAHSREDTALTAMHAGMTARRNVCAPDCGEDLSALYRKGEISIRVRLLIEGEVPPLAGQGTEALG